MTDGAAFEGVKMRNRFRSFTVLATIASLAAFPLSTEASHSWGTYHWAHASNPVTIRVVDSMSSSWDDNLDVAIGDWDQSQVLTLVQEDGDASSRARKRCSAISGKVRACNAAYGYNGWLGLAQIWVSGGHIVQAIAKMNDSYLASSAYSETNRQHVICQEIGHDWGLGHQDESGADLNTCMDYARALDNEHPNQHDFDQLATIYQGHLDSSSSGTTKSRGKNRASLQGQEQWGKKVHGSANGRSAVFVRDLGGDLKVITHVTWAR